MSASKIQIKKKKRFLDCRQCLVCGGKTISAHLGMDVCRACSVFYRRSVGKRTYECKSRTNNCEVNRDHGSSCRKCRFALIEKLIGESGGEIKQEQSSDLSSPAEGSEEIEMKECHSSECKPSGSVSHVCTPATPQASLKIVERVRAGYRTMSQIRVTSELLVRPDPPHPMIMNERDCPYIEATFATVQNANRILLSSIVGFSPTAFPEFAEFSREEQWALSKNFFYRFSIFESSYRAHMEFPKHPERQFAGFTIWFDHEYDERYFADCPNQIDIKGVKNELQNHCKHNLHNFRAFMQRTQLTEHEFLIVLALMFWTIEGVPLSDEIVRTAERIRLEIMQELHTYYREERGLLDYAARIGELLTLVQVFDRSDCMKEKFEFLRLMNVISDDAFMYRVQRDTSPLP
ncbi:hypothetical protein PFISCL1PPCAC_13140, partial [Pristionchus fissidentatus]